MTSKDLSRFWELSEPLEDGPPPAPLTDEQLAAFETGHGLQLPSSFVQLYRIQNGGFSEWHRETFWPIGPTDRGHAEVAALQQLCEGYHQNEDLSAYWAAELGDLNRVIAFFGDGHFYFVLNYNTLKDSEPLVWYVADFHSKNTNMIFLDWIFSSGGTV